MDLEELLHNGEYCDLLLTEARTYGEEGSLESLRKAYDSLQEKLTISEDQQYYLKEVVGSAHLLMLDLEGAAEYFEGNRLKMERLKGVALWLGNDARLIKRIAPEKYSDFIRDMALPNVWMGRDEKGFYLDEEELDSILKDLQEQEVDTQQALKETVLSMERNGRKNIPKKLLLAYYANDKELYSKVFAEYEQKKNSNRKNIDSIVQNYCALHDLRFIKKMQEGDYDPFFPIASNMYLVERNGEKEVFKEHLRLYTDFSRHDGYNKEKEIYEQFSDDNIIDYLGHCNVDGIEFLRFKVFDGLDLSEFTKEEMLLPFDETLRIIRTHADVLDSLQQQGILYLDVKDKNVMYDGNEMKLLDFGMAQTFDKVDASTFARSVLSTPAYIPPEWGSVFVATRTSEVFQLGVLFHQMLTGKHPFAHVDFTEGDEYRESEIIKFGLSNIYNDYKAPEQLASHPEMVSLLEQMLHKDPTERPTVKEVTERIGDYLLQQVI